jgi:dynein heavy chain
MKDVIRKASRDCFTMKIPEFIDKYPAQAALLGLQFIWTRDVQIALGKSKTEKGIIQSAWRRVGSIMSELTAIAQKEVLLNI